MILFGSKRPRIWLLASLTRRLKVGTGDNRRVEANECGPGRSLRRIENRVERQGLLGEHVTKGTAIAAA